MVAALLELHDQVDEPSDGPLHTLAQSLVVLGQDPPVGGWVGGYGGEGRSPLLSD